MAEGRSAEKTELAPSKASSSLGRQALVRWTRRYAIFLILGALIIVFEAEQPAFLRVDNVFSVLHAVSSRSEMATENAPASSLPARLLGR